MKKKISKYESAALGTPVPQRAPGPTQHLLHQLCHHRVHRTLNSLTLLLNFLTLSTLPHFGEFSLLPLAPKLYRPSSLEGGLEAEMC